MKSKQLIRFYFGADALNDNLDKMITRYAYGAAETGTEQAAEKIISIIEIKDGLQGLWAYLDGAMSELSGGEREVLKFYGGLRVGIRGLPDGSAREIRRVTAKFTRRLRRVGRFGEELKLLRRFYCLT